ncbi:MAG: hypothetical protein HYU27_08935 [Acidobacteria bacterium]|nr:hypothetical protein [Acidobacteriota bacterium]
MEVPLEYRNIPAQLEITGDAANSVQVRLRGSSNLIKEISPRDLSTTIDLGGMRAGENVVPLSSKNVKAPFGAEVIRVNPSSVRFNLERTISKEVPVAAAISGQPADGYEIGPVVVNPNTVRIEGPESRVEQLDSVPTVPIRIDRRQESFAQPADLEVSDPQIRVLLSTPIEVRIEVQKKQ